MQEYVIQSNNVHYPPTVSVNRAIVREQSGRLLAGPQLQDKVTPHVIFALCDQAQGAGIAYEGGLAGNVCMALDCDPSSPGVTKRQLPALVLARALHPQREATALTLA